MDQHRIRRREPSTVALNLDEFKRLCEHHDLRNDREVAAALGVTHATIWRTGTGNTGPSERFIAGALRAFPETTFEALFRCVDYPRPSSDASDASDSPYRDYDVPLIP